MRHNTFPANTLIAITILSISLSANTVHGDLIYLSDEVTNAITRLSDGTLVTIASGFQGLHGTVVDAAGNIYAASSTGPRIGDDPYKITRITPSGAASTFTTGLPYIYALAIDKAGNIYGTGNLNGTVMKISPTGAISTIATGLKYPTGIAVDANGKVYVAEFNDNRPNGSITVITGTTPSTFAAPVHAPSGLAIDSHGALFVSNDFSAISKVSEAGTLSTVATGFQNPIGIAFDSNGALYVADPAAKTFSSVSPSGVVSTILSGLAFPEFVTVVPALNPPSPTMPNISPHIFTTTFGSLPSLAFSNGTAEVELAVHLIGDAPSAELMDTWTTGVEAVWSNQYAIADGALRYPIHVHMSFVAADGPGVTTVTVHAGNGQDDMLNWYTGRPSGWPESLQPIAIAHEAGHLMGIYDEYSGGFVDPVSRLVDPLSIMGSQLGMPRERHYEWIVDWLHGASGRDLHLAKAPTFRDGIVGDAPVDGTPGRLQSPVPEPSTLALIFSGAIAMCIACGRSRVRRACNTPGRAHE